MRHQKRRMLEPRRQRALNTLIAESFGERYKGDWYAYAMDCINKGQGVDDVANNFKNFGVEVPVPTLYEWIRKRRITEARSGDGAAVQAA